MAINNAPGGQGHGSFHKLHVRSLSSSSEVL